VVTNAFILLIHVMANVCQDSLNVENIDVRIPHETYLTIGNVETNASTLLNHVMINALLATLNVERLVVQKQRITKTTDHAGTNV